MKKLLIVCLAFAMVLMMAGCELLFPGGGTTQTPPEETPVYTVRFVTNGGTRIDAVEVEENDTLERPEDPTREGMKLVGWYSDPDLEIEWDFDVDVVISDMKLYAKWETAHVHSYTEKITSATCTKSGYVTYACECGDTYVEDGEAPKGHAWIVESVNKPGCTEEGYTTFYCRDCGEKSVGEEVPALGHKYSGETVDPTCTEGGYTTYVCSACNDTYVDNETEALGHSYDETVTAPTCTEGGYTTYVCSVCDDTYKGDETDSLGHSYTQTITEATCTEGGYITYVCSVCDDTHTDDETEPLGHSYKETVTAPTCTEDGYTTNVCSECGDTYIDNEIEALGHSYDETVTAPTCTEGGYTTYVCSACGDTYADNETDALGHTPGSDATCTEDQICTVCSAVITEKFGHTLGADATCTEDQVCTACGEIVTEALGHAPADGLLCTEASVCKRCGLTLESLEHKMLPADCENPARCSACIYTEGEALGHIYDMVTVTYPTCTEGGYTTHTCSRCNSDSYVTDVIDALGHIEGAPVIEDSVEATCTEDGSYDTVVYCSACDTELSRETTEIEAFGHDFDEVVIEPTCIKGGYTAFSCKTCGYEEKGDKMSPLGHNYVNVVTAPTCTEEGYTESKCTRCQNVKSTTNRKPALGHSYSATVTEPTCTDGGYTTYHCSGCGDTYVDNAVDALGHSYSDSGFCTVCGLEHPDRLEITYVLNGGTNSEKNLSSVIKGTECKLYSPTHSDGYSFAGWYLDSDFNELLKSLADLDGDATLYAKWVSVSAPEDSEGIETPEVPF